MSAPRTALRFRHATAAALAREYTGVDSVERYVAGYVRMHPERGTVDDVRSTALYKALTKFFPAQPEAGQEVPFKAFLEDLVASASQLLPEDAGESCPGVSAAEVEVEARACVKDSRWCRSVLASAFLGNLVSDPALPDRLGFDMSIICMNDWGKCLVAAHRVSCLVQYFLTSAGEAPRKVKWERVTMGTEEILRLPEWGHTLPAGGGVTVHAGPMEEPPAHAFVNFANQIFNFGQWIPSCTQEEVMQSCCPEHNVGMLFYGKIPDDGAILTHNVRRYADYTGYGSSFEFIGAHRSRSDGPALQTILALDASVFDQHTRAGNIRDIRKAYLAFKHTAEHHIDAPTCRISTGAWGCGAFGGHRTHKLLQQLVAAALCNPCGAAPPRVTLCFSTYNRDPTELQAFVAAVAATGATCRELLDLMCSRWTSNASYDDTDQLLCDIRRTVAARRGPSKKTCTIV
eukprot:TRINITY_DN3272_c0_g1_i4.p1 TRINITY_DN3272_c0_g1~~TRINITY_DN3272_c0_g1_i4.p1  ORF type:complete len:459 (+),score=128.58 TRINITY_DN3272_c0_g1_i4:206-1582(+)